MYVLILVNYGTRSKDLQAVQYPPNTLFTCRVGQSLSRVFKASCVGYCYGISHVTLPMSRFIVSLDS